MSIEKRVDEDWKQQVEKEKSSVDPAPKPPPSGDGPSRRRAGEGATPAGKSSGAQGEFAFLLSSLSMQALIALGEMPHPATQTPQLDLEQARMLIDILGTLKEKTQGNLTEEEAKMLEGLLYELRMKFVSKTKEVSAP